MDMPQEVELPGVRKGGRSSGWGGGKGLHAKAKMWVFRAQLGMDLPPLDTQRNWVQ